MNQLQYMRLVKEALTAMQEAGEVDDFRVELYQDGVKVLVSRGDYRAMSKFRTEPGATDQAHTEHVVRTVQLLLQPIEGHVYG